MKKIKRRRILSASALKVQVKLYRIMLKIRLAEEKIVELYPTDRIQSPIHLSIGQEAVSAGLCLAMAPSDHLYGTYRGHGPYIAKGGDLKKMFAELYGKDTGCARGKGGSMHLAAPEKGLMGCSAIVASTIPIATGDALASHMQGRRRVAVAFFGDGGVDEGVFFESINFACLKNLPIIYVCENNRYAIHSKVSDRHSQVALFRIGEGLGLYGKRFDGNDAGLVYETMSKATQAVRKGAGPILLEYMTFRWREHVGSGSDFREAYREKGEEARALASDPLKIAKKALLAEGVVPQMFELWEKETRQEVEAAVQFAEASPFPASDRLTADLYASY